MEACGTLNGFEDVEALIKSKVGEFLAAQAKIRTLLRNPSPSIMQKAKALEVDQKFLEGELGKAQASLANFQSGAWTFGEMIGVSDTAARIVKHLGNVSALEKEASGSAVMVASSSWTGLGSLLAAGVAAMLVWQVSRR